MIQRIQSIYLMIAAIAIALLFAFPLANFLSDHGAYVFSITGLKNMVPGDSDPIRQVYFLPLPVLTAAVALLSIYAVFQYRNRQLQIKLTSICVILNILLIMGIFLLYINLIEKKVGIVPDYRKAFGIYLPLVSLVFIVLANRAIKSDERLVRSTDRLR